MTTLSIAKTVVTFSGPVDFVIDLTIPGFSSLKTETKWVESVPVFVLNSSWQLHLLPLQRGQTILGRLYPDCMYAYVQQTFRAGVSTNKVHVKFTISVMDAATSRACSGMTVSGKNDIDGIGNSITYRGLTVNHSDIWGPNPKLKLTDDVLRIRAELKCSKILPQELNIVKSSKVQYSLHDLNRTMYKSDVGRDFTLVSSDGVERHVHKAILNSASPVFSRMFESNLEECRTGRCDISDITSVTLDAMLRFMYYGSLKNLAEHAKTLIVAAEKYELLDLKDFCEEALIAGIRTENVSEMLMLADRLSAEDLKKAALQHYASNPGKVLDSGKIDDIVGAADPNLVKDMISAMLKLQPK